MNDARRTENRTGGEMLLQDAALAETVRRLVEAYQPERIFLSGSKARGDAGADAELDPHLEPLLQEAAPLRVGMTRNAMVFQHPATFPSQGVWSGPLRVLKSLLLYEQRSGHPRLRESLVGSGCCHVQRDHGSAGHFSGQRQPAAYCGQPFGHRR